MNTKTNTNEPHIAHTASNANHLTILKIYIITIYSTSSKNFNNKRKTNELRDLIRTLLEPRALSNRFAFTNRMFHAARRLWQITEWQETDA